MGWVTWGLVSLIGWGLWGAFVGVASKYGTPLGVAAGTSLMEAIFLAPWLTQIGRSASWWMVAAGGTGALAYLAMFLALRSGGGTAPVVALTSLYPVLTAVFMWVGTGESLTWKQGIGIMMAVGAAVLIANP